MPKVAFSSDYVRFGRLLRQSNKKDMKTKRTIIAACLVICAIGIRSFASEKPGHEKTAAKDTEPGFAVVELFTSEGCSSCPPADELIAKVQKESDGKPVYILAYHVDYWNRLGWKDQFSNAAYSQRQGLYASWLNASLYTPQAVVNGVTEFVGSDEGRLRKAVSSALSRSGKENVSISHATLDHDKVNIGYQIAGVAASGTTAGGAAASNTSLLIALIQKNAVSKVLKGENGGRTLSHAQIVRDLETISLNAKKDGTATLKAPEGMNAGAYEVIAFLQNNRTGEITAAGKAPVTLQPIK